MSYWPKRGEKNVDDSDFEMRRQKIRTAVAKVMARRGRLTKQRKNRIRTAARKIRGESENGEPFAPPLLSKGSQVEAQIGKDGKFRRATILKMPKHGRWVDVYDDVTKKRVRRVDCKLIRQMSNCSAPDLEMDLSFPASKFHSGDKRPRETTFTYSKGSEVEARIGRNKMFRRAVVVKKPKHNRWVDVFCDVTKTVHKRVPTKLLRQLSNEGREDVEYQILEGMGYEPLGTTRSFEEAVANGVAIFPQKGQEVQVQYLGSWQRAHVIRVPKHRRWFNVYMDEYKVTVKRVPKELIRRLDESQPLKASTSSTVEKRFVSEAKNSGPSSSSSSLRNDEDSFRFEACRSDQAGAIKDAMKRVLLARRGGISTDEVPNVFNPKKGDEVEAKIGTDGLFRRAVVIKKPRHERWVHVYDDIEKKLHKRVPTELVRQRSDDRSPPDDLELE